MTRSITTTPWIGCRSTRAHYPPPPPPYPPASQDLLWGTDVPQPEWKSSSGSSLEYEEDSSTRQSPTKVLLRTPHNMRINFQNSAVLRRIMLFTSYHWKLNKHWLKPRHVFNLRGLGKNPRVEDRKTSASTSTLTSEVWTELWAIYRSHCLCPEVSHRWWHCHLETGLSPPAFQRHAFEQVDFPLLGRAPLG